MASFADNLARLRVAAATGVAPPDLVRWAAGVVADLASVAERVETRNVLLREAAAQVSGSRWAKARRLEREIRALAVAPGLRERAVDDGVRELVAQALAVAPAPRSRRQLLAILR
jgi:hypothetical protein